MNYRAIFNPNYNFIGILLIISFITILLLLNKNLKQAINLISKTFFWTGILILIVAIILNISLNIFLPYQYKIFVEVISKNVIRYSVCYSIICIVLGLLGYGGTQMILKEKTKE